MPGSTLIDALDALVVLLYNAMCGPAPKYEQRMSRSIGLRLPDAQYDWLIERTIEYDGDMSEATRDAIDAARLLYEILSSPDPHGRLQAVLDESKRAEAREAFFDEHGRYPEEGPG